MLLDKGSGIRTKILNAIMEDPEMILLMKERYVDEEVWKFCIEREPSLFKKMKHPSESVCLFACEVDGANLKYIKNKFTYIPITGVMVTAAVKSNPKAILSVPKKFLTLELEEMAFDEDPSLMAYFDYIRPEYVRKLIVEKPYAIKYIKEPNEDVICDTIIRSPLICTHVSKLTNKMMDILMKYHPNYYYLYKNSMIS